MHSLTLAIFIRLILNSLFSVHAASCFPTVPTIHPGLIQLVKWSARQVHKLQDKATCQLLFHLKLLSGERGRMGGGRVGQGSSWQTAVSGRFARVLNKFSIFAGWQRQQRQPGGQSALWICSYINLTWCVSPHRSPPPLRILLMLHPLHSRV